MPTSLSVAAAVWRGRTKPSPDSRALPGTYPEFSPQSDDWQPSIHPGFANSAQQKFTLLPKSALPSSAPGSDPVSRQFWRAHNILKNIFTANGNFELELGSNPFTFIDIGCAPGGFARFLLDHSQCIAGTGLSLPVERGGVKMMFSDSRLLVVRQDVMQASRHPIFDQLLVDLCIADASSSWKFGSRITSRNDEPGMEALGGIRSKSPALAFWAVLLQELWLGLSVLGHGGIMIFEFIGPQACADEWQVDACTCLLAFMDDLFTSTAPFTLDSKVSYIVCRGFRHDVFLTTAAAETLHQSVLEVLEHGAVHGLLNVKLFNEMRAMGALPLKALWIHNMYGKLARGGKTHADIRRQGRQDQCGRLQRDDEKPWSRIEVQCNSEEQFQKRLLNNAVLQMTDPAISTKVRVKNTFLEEFSLVPRLRRVASVPACAKLAAVSW